ncbi:MAG: helix-turn-helix domain-containing protein [Candidatus Obscuribacterales bacterium]|nr:helix-turn-helix domain-containing protein [Candidatus Obscuribacterales bacterium]
MQTLMLKQEVEPKLLTLGKFIKQKRMSLGLSQEELADRAGLHRTYVSDVERGIRNLTLGATWFIAHGLGLDLRDMIEAMDATPENTEIAPGQFPVQDFSVSRGS